MTPQEVHRRHRTGRSAWYTSWLCRHSNRPWQAEVLGKEQPHEVQQGKREVLHLGRQKPRHRYTRGADQLESSSAEMDLGVLVANKLTKSQQCTLHGKGGQRQPGLHYKKHCQQARGSDPSPPALVSHVWSAGSTAGLPSPREIQAYRRGCSPGPQRQRRVWSSWGSRRDWESWQCPAWGKKR